MKISHLIDLLFLAIFFFRIRDIINKIHKKESKVAERTHKKEGEGEKETNKRRVYTVYTRYKKEEKSEEICLVMTNSLGITSPRNINSIDDNKSRASEGRDKAKKE